MGGLLVSPGGRMPPSIDDAYSCEWLRPAR